MRALMYFPAALLAAPLLLAGALPSRVAAQGVPAAPAQGIGGVSGTVRDARTGEPIADARVIVRGQQGIVAAATTTGEDGRYRLARLRAGVYAVEVLRLGYAKRAEADVVVSEGRERSLDFAMEVVAVATQEVVVVGARRAEKVADSDVTVSVVEGAEIARRARPTVQGALKSVPGVDYFETGLGQQQANTRGFVSVFGSNMLVLVDGRLGSAPGHNMTLSQLLVTQADVARAEVVAGASSALYGANAASGVLNLVTIDPRANPGGSVTVGAGQRSTVHVSARQAAMIGEKVGYKVVAESWQGRDFEVTNTFTSTNPVTGATATLTDAPDFDVSNRSISGGLYLYPSTAARVAWTGGFTRANYINQTNVARLQMKDWDALFQQLRVSVDGGRMGSLAAMAAYTAHDAGDSYYLDMESRFQMPKTVPGGQGVSADSARTLAAFADRSRRMELGLQHFFHVGGKHFVTTGVDWRHWMPNSEGIWLSDGPNGEPVRIDELGIYGQYQAHLAPRLRLTLAGRWDDHSDIGSTVSPKASLTYEVAPGQTLRASANRAFNAPIPYQLYARSFIVQRGPLPMWNRGGRLGFDFVNLRGGETPQPIEPLKSLDVTSYELGWRGELGRRLTADVSVYSARYRNFLTSAIEINRPDSGIIAVDRATGDTLREYTRSFVNYGELPVWGVDAAAEISATEALRFAGSISYQDPRRFRNPRPGVAEPGFNVPLSKWKLGATYDDLLGRGSVLEASAVHVNRFFYQSGLSYTTGWVPTYTTVDLAAEVPLVTVRGQRTRLSLAAQNLFDANHVELPGGAELRRQVIVSFTTDWK